jgi:hypothetical protein
VPDTWNAGQIINRSNRNGMSNIPYNHGIPRPVMQVYTLDWMNWQLYAVNRTLNLWSKNIYIQRILSYKLIIIRIIIRIKHLILKEIKMFGSI